MAHFDEADVIEIFSSEEDCPITEQKSDVTGGIHLLNEFIAVCSPLLKPNQQKAITKLLKEKFGEAKAEYTQSDAFRTLIHQHISDLQTKKKSVYVHIQDVKTSLMRATDKTRVKLNAAKEIHKPSVEAFTTKKEQIEVAVKEEVKLAVKQPDRDATKNGEEEDQGSCGVDRKENPPASLEMSCETIVSEGQEGDSRTVEVRSEDDQEARSVSDGAGPSGQSPIAEDSDKQPEQQEKGKGSQKQIRKLERMLGRLAKAIRKLEEQELTFDEMDESDSIHIQEYQLRRRFVKVYNMLCKLNNCSETTGRVIEQRVHYEGTRFPEINRRLERLVNKKDFFPDFHDVKTAIYKTNLKKNLGLDKRRVNSIAQEAFEDLGGKLQRRRQQDFILNFSSHSTIDFVHARDMADKDPELKKKLNENKTVAKQKMIEVDDAFVRRQEDCEEMGINLEASEQSEIEDPQSDAHSDGPTDNEGEDDQPVLKKLRLDSDGCPKENDENGEEKSIRENEDDRNDDGNRDKIDHNVAADFQSNDQSNTDTVPGQSKHSVSLQRGDSTKNPDTNVHSTNLSSNVPLPTLSNGAVNSINNRGALRNGQISFSETSDYRGVQTGFTDHNGISSHPCVAQSMPPPRLDTPEQALKSLKLVQPMLQTDSMPLVITNVCSLSPNAGFFPGAGNKSWDEGKATIAKVVDDGEGGILIGPPSQHQIMVMKSSKSVKLQTSLDSDSNTEHPRAKSIPAPSPPPSVSSTQPELDMSPEVEEIVEVSTDSGLRCNNQRYPKAIIASKETASYAPHRNRTQASSQVVVSRMKCGCNASSFVRGRQANRQEASNSAHRSFSVQSTHVSNSCVSRAKSRSTSFVHRQDRVSVSTVLSGSAPAPTASASNSSRALPAQYRVLSSNPVNQLRNLKTSPKWQTVPQGERAVPRAPVPEKNCSRKLTYAASKPLTNVDKNDGDLDVIVISDSELDSPKDVAQKRAESPEVICISDSD